MGSAILLAEEPIIIGLDADMSSGAAISGESIRRGAHIAIEEINKAGGILGRILRLEVRDHRGNPARGRDNIEYFGNQKNVVAVLGGIHTPVALNELSVIHAKKLIYLGAWAAGTSIVDNGYQPNYVFRVSVRDEFAGEFLVKKAKAQGYKKPGLLLERTGWGRSNEAAMNKAATKHGLTVVDVAWFHWGATSIKKEMLALLNKGADVIMLVANAKEGVVIIRDLASISKELRKPVLSHWGIIGGDFFNQIGWDILKDVNLQFLQTFNFTSSAVTNRGIHLEKLYLKYFTDITKPTQIPAPDGVSHAYDLVNLLVSAIREVGTTDRQRVREALENLPPHQGALREYKPAFTPDRHDALTLENYILARFSQDGSIEPLLK